MVLLIAGFAEKISNLILFIQWKKWLDKHSKVLHKTRLLIETQYHLHRLQFVKILVIGRNVIFLIFELHKHCDHFLIT